MESIVVLSEKLSSYLEPKQIEQVNKAYEFANEAHSGQFRSSGDPYVSHPIAVANILSSFHMDEDSLLRLCCMMSLKTVVFQKKLLRNNSIKPLQT